MSLSHAAGALGVAVLLLLSGCSPSTPADARTAPRAPLAAIARGYVDDGAGLARIAAPRDGVVQKVLVEEGDTVVPGQTLAVMNDRQARLGAEAAQAEIGVRQAQLDAARVRAAGAQRDAGRVDRLARLDASTTQDADQAGTAAQVAAADSAQAAQALRAAQARARLEALEVEVRTVRAPIAGKVLRRSASAGASVAAAAPLFVLESNAPRVIRAELDESFADKVRPGMSAVVSREFDDSHTYRARVLRVGDIFATPALDDDPTSRSDTRVVTVVLVLQGAPDLKLGQRVLVSFTK